MRTIKFRVRNIQTQRIIGYEMLLEHGWMFQEADGGWLSGVFDVDKRYKREQYVGADDMDGVEIYSGDILTMVISKGQQWVVGWDKKSVSFRIPKNTEQWQVT